MTLPAQDEDHHNKKQCPHENVTQLELLDYDYPSTHGPRTEVWRVRCDDCGKVYTERFIGN